MSVKEIEAAITQLGPEELAELVAWLEEHQAQAWDEQIVRDARAGRFEALIQRAREQFESGQCRSLRGCIPRAPSETSFARHGGCNRHEGICRHL